MKWVNLALMIAAVLLVIFHFAFWPSLAVYAVASFRVLHFRAHPYGVMRGFRRDARYADKMSARFERRKWRVMR